MGGTLQPTVLLTKSLLLTLMAMAIKTSLELAQQQLAIWDQSLTVLSMILSPANLVRAKQAIH